MNMDIEKILDEMPRRRIGFIPTPLQKLENLSKKYGIELYMKRDDLIGPEFGGNKIRKLEFLLGDALVKGSDYVVTYGGIQSNHCRETVAACRIYGLNPILYLIVKEEPEEYLGNLLLNKIMNAEIHYVIQKLGMSDYEARLKSYEMAEVRIRELERHKHICYDIPGGGFTPVGCLGFVLGFIELVEQLKDKSIELDYIVHATGSAGTLTGLIAGKILLKSNIKVLSFGVAEEPPDRGDMISKNFSGIGKLLHINIPEYKGEINIDYNYCGEGYTIPSFKSTEAIKEVAREEGIILDPAYTAKAMGGLLDYIKTGKISKDNKVVFWHTGGTPSIFAEKEIVGKLWD